MRIIRADHLGMCFGVRDAITLAQNRARLAPLTVFGDLVHNEQVLADLQARQVRIERDLNQVRTREVMITAHGAADTQVAAIRQRGHTVVEATCPLVRFAHRSAQELADQGYHPVIVGLRDHVEVRGLTGDLQAFDVVLSEADVDALQERPRFGVIAQTTQPVERVRRLVERLRQRFPRSEVRFTDTVCQPTKLRQRAALDLAQRADAVVVIGGAHSNNTRELVEACRRHCPRVFHVQSPDDLHPDWFRPSDTVGLTAGTSTPDSIIDGVEHALEALAITLGSTDEHAEPALTAAHHSRGF